MRRDGLLASRIHLFGSPLSWAHEVHTCDFVPCPYSDHVAVVLRVSPPVQLFRGPGRWKLNSSIFRDPDFSSIIESFWASWRRRKKDFRSIQLLWDRGKERLKGLAIAFCRRLFRRGSVPSSLIWLLIKKPKLIKALSLSRIFMRGYWLVLLILTA